MSDPSDSTFLQWLRVEVRNTVGARGLEEVTRKVYCPNKARFVAFDDCSDCPHRFAVDERDRDVFLVCEVDPSTRPAEEASPEPSSHRATGDTIGDLMNRDVVCARPSQSVQELLVLLLDRNISGAPVVNDKGEPIGVVTKTDVVRLLQQGTPEGSSGPMVLQGAEGREYVFSDGLCAEALATIKVESIMSPLLFSLHEEASVERAAALMAYEGIHRVPVVSGSTKQVVGLISSLDVLRCLAQRAGYIMPSRHGGQSPSKERG